MQAGWVMATILRLPSAARKAGALLALAAAVLSCSGRAREGAGGDGGNSPLVLIGANLLSFDSAASPHRALLLRHGRIEAIGDSSLVDDPRARGARVLRFPGGTIAPALVDHHVHLFNVGITLLNDRDRGRLFVDLSQARSLGEVYDAVRRRAAAATPEAWIVGAGWNQAAWGMSAMPERGTLDAAAPANPVYLGRSDGHAGWVNARALAAAGINRATSDPPGGAIGRRPDGTPNGILLERANDLVTPHVPALADSDVVAAWRLAAEAMAARGVTRVYDAGVLPMPGLVAMNAPFAHYLALLRRADSVAPLPISVSLMIPAPSAAAESLLAAPSAARELSPRIRVTHLKLFADGALGSRGAALTHPYADDAATRGVPRMTTAEIAVLAGAALDAGLGVATHAIGDEAVKRTLDAYEQLLRTRPHVASGRLRIEHFSYAREEDFARAVRLGVLLSIQENFNSAMSDDPPFGAQRVGAENERRVYAWSRLRKLGAKLAEGSDYFTRPGNAFDGVRAAMERRYAVGEGMDERDKRRVAYELNSTWWGVADAPEPWDPPVGRVAELVVLSGNPINTAASDLATLTVVATVTGQRVVSGRPAADHMDGSLREVP